MGYSKHDRIAHDLAKKFHAEYNEGKGPDIKTPSKVVEVVTHEGDLYSSVAQVSRFQKPRYFAVPRGLVSKAKEVTDGTGVGVMTSTGIIQKRSRG